MKERGGTARGTTPELERLLDAYRTMARDRSRLSLLVGPPGCGSGRMVDRFVALARPQVVLRSVGARSRTFGTLTDLLREGRAALGGDADAVVDLGAFAERRQRLFAEVSAVLGRLGGFLPPVVFIEDLDRADGATLDLLQFLLDPTARAAGGPAFFLATASSAGAPSLRELLRSEATDVLRLDPLDEAGVRAYLAQDEVVRRVLDRSGGLPDRIDELLEARGHGAAALPTTLSDTARALFDAVVVVDRPARLETLCRVADVPPRLSDAEELTAAGVTQRRLREGVLTLRPRTRGRRDARYERLPEEARRELHRRASEVFEEASLEEAARHAAKAGEHERALRLALAACADPAAGLAGRDAMELIEEVRGDARVTAPEMAAKLAAIYLSVGEGAEALTHARRLREARPEDGEAVALLAEALLVCGELDQAWAELERAHEHPLDDAARAEVHLRQADVAYWQGRQAVAERFAARAEEAAAAGGWLPIELEAACVRARVELLAGRLDEAAQIGEAGLERAERAGLGQHQCDFTNVLGNVAWRRDDLDRALFLFRRASELADRLGALHRWATAVGNIAVVDQVQGRLGRAADGYRRTLRILEHTGFRNQSARSLNNLASLRGMIGDPRAALELCGRAEELATETAVQLEIASIQGGGFRELGSWREAEQAYRRAEELAVELGDRERLAEARLGLARVALESGRVDVARERLEGVGDHLRSRDRARLAILRARLADASERLAMCRSAVMAAEASGGALLEQRARVELALALADARLDEMAQAELAQVREIEDRFAAQLSPADREIFGERPDALRCLSLEARLPAGRGAEVAPLPHGVSPLVGDSPPMRELRALIDRVGPTDALVLIHGESGVGKELVADALHDRSRRRDAPLVKVNCAALVESLLLSELFGHERGAFTGAHAARKGRFELADGGTLFLDEIGEISARTQAALLRVLQDKMFERVGGTRTHAVDVRVIAATNRDLAALVREGRFREDLYYRLAGIVVGVPPLRDRFADLGRLCALFLADIGPEMGRGAVSIGADALAALRRYAWPGNVRELQNVLRSATLASDRDVLGASDVRPFLGSPLAEPPDEARSEASLPAMFYDAVRQGHASVYDLRKAMERACIERALEETGGNISRAAELIGMKRSRVSQLVKEHGLKKEGGA